jgi:phosphate transport system protein
VKLNVPRTALREEKARLLQDISEMGTLVQQSLATASLALKDRDVALAEKVKNDETAINEMQYRIEDEAVVIIATQQPVASDLRELTAVPKIVAHLERIGDFAVHLAKLAIKTRALPQSQSIAKLLKMAEIEGAMIKDGVFAFIAGDADAARRTAGLDGEIDALHRSVVGDLLKIMCEDPDQIEQAVQTLKVANNLERLGDHVTNMCEAIIYSVTGQRVELND